MHAAVREGFRKACDGFGNQAMRLVEEPEGKGLDCVILTLGEVELALRWGRYGNGRISRNNTKRQTMTQEQLTLCGGVDLEIDNLSTASVGYTVEDDYTEAGQPQWWVGRIALLRERVDMSDFIEDIAVFKKPNHSTSYQELDTPRVIARNQEYDALSKIVANLRRKIG